MRLGAKILLGFMVTNLIIITLALSIFFFGRRANSAAVVLSDEIMPLVSSAANVRFNVAMQAFTARNFISSGNMASWEQAQEHSATVYRFLQAIDSTMAAYPVLHTPAIEKAVTNIRAAYQGYNDMAAKLPELLALTTRASEEVTRFHGLFIDMCRQIYDRQLQVHAERELGNLKNESLAGEAAEAAVRRRFNRVNMIVEIMLLADTLLKEITLAQLTNNTEHIDIAIQLCDKLSNDMATLSKGSTVQIDIDLQTQATAHAAELSSYVKTLGDALITSAKESQARSDTMNTTITLASDLLQAVNDLSVEMGHNSKDAISQMTMALLIGVVAALAVSTLLAWFISANISKQANRLIDVLKEGVHDIDEASSNLSSASQELARGATENAASLEETSSILEEITTSTQELAKDSADATDVMAQAGAAVQKANVSIGELTVAMEKILVSGSEISKIIKDIDEIAFQTNLLALNAAVEAARAGEAGAGFAVVAEEVRNLATRSADAAKNTSDLIENTIASINTGSGLVKVAVDEFKNIEEQSGKVSELLQHMAGATNEQASGLNQINNAMLHIDKVTQGTAASSEEVSSMSGVLSNDATVLIDAVESLYQMVYGNNAHISNGNGHKKALPKPKGAAHKLMLE